MRTGIGLALSLAAAGGGAAAAQSESPMLLRFEPPERGGPTALPEASPSGKIDLSGACVALEIMPGKPTVIISTADAGVGRDSTGLYLQYQERRFRHGQWVKGGGGHYDRFPEFGPVQSPVPPACQGGSFLVFYGIEPFAPSKLPPQSPPPPPPAAAERG